MSRYSDEIDRLTRVPENIAHSEHYRVVTLLELLDDWSKNGTLGELSKSIQIFPLAAAARHCSVLPAGSRLMHVSILQPSFLPQVSVLRRKSSAA